MKSIQAETYPVHFQGIAYKEITDLINQNNKVSKKIIYNYCLKLKNEI